MRASSTGGVPPTRRWPAGTKRFGQRPLGFWLVPMMLAFPVLEHLALIGMDVSMAARGVPGGGQRIPVFAAMGVVSLGMLWTMMRKAKNSIVSRS